MNILFIMTILVIVGCSQQLPEAEQAFNDKVKQKLKKFRTGTYEAKIKVDTAVLSRKVRFRIKVSPETQSLEFINPTFAKGPEEMYLAFSVSVQKVDGDVLYFNIRLNNAYVVDALKDVEANSIEFMGESYYGYVGVQNDVFVIDFLVRTNEGQTVSYYITDN